MSKLTHIEEGLRAVCDLSTFDDKIEYSIDENSRKITAYIKNTRLHPLQFLVKTGVLTAEEFYLLIYNNREFESLMSHFIIEGSYAGRAQCHPDDEWNVEEGMKLAKARCLYKYNRAMANAIFHYATFLERRVMKVARLQNKLVDNTEKWYGYDLRNFEND